MFTFGVDTLHKQALPNQKHETIRINNKRIITSKSLKL